MSFLADDDVILKYNKIWKKITTLIVNPVMMKNTRVKTFQEKVATKFTNNEVPKENTHYSCIAATIL